MLEDIQNIVVGSSNYTIFYEDNKFVNGEKYVLGQINFNEKHITIATKHRDEIEWARTLLHEISHAILYEYGRESKNTLSTEVFCDAFSSGLLMTMKDNRKFFEILMDLTTTKLVGYI